MFESFFSRLLSSLLSTYFDYDDGGGKPKGSRTNSRNRGSTNKHYISLWSGFITLTGLKGKLDVFNTILIKYLPLTPVSIKHFNIGRLQITVPWAQIGNIAHRNITNIGNNNQGPNSKITIVIDDCTLVAALDMQREQGDTPDDPDNPTQSPDKRLQEIQR